MLSHAIISTLAAALAFTCLAAAAPINEPKLSVTAQLQLADTGVDRYSVLTKNTDFVYDFSNGGVRVANRKSFPALTGTGLSLAPAHVPGCSVAALHIHPRSAEIFYLVSGRVITAMVPESGVIDPTTGKQRVIRNELTANQTTIFPQGSFHMQMNVECEPAVVVVAFGSDDPGASLIVPGLFGLDADFVAGTFGNTITSEEIKKFKELVSQQGIFELEECKKKCNLK